MDNLQSNIFIAGKRLNDLTGYSGIEVMKKEIEQQGTHPYAMLTQPSHKKTNTPPEELVRATRAALRAAKESYSAAIAQRSASQREVNELLQRKHAWSASDLERFTSLYRSDHANEQAETAAQEALAGAERRAEEAAAKLSKSILARYHEEQIWSDKIRRMSTWGTWGLMGVNVLLFLVFQIGVEPWRRRRLVKGFEEKVMEALEREGAGGAGGVRGGVKQHTDDGLKTLSLATSTVTREPVAEDHEPAPDIPPLEQAAEAAAAAAAADLHPEIPATEEVLSSSDAPKVGDRETQPPLPTTPSPSPSPPPPPPSLFSAYKSLLQDLFSDRAVTITQRDLTSVALEGAAAGMAVVGILVVLLRPR